MAANIPAALKSADITRFAVRAAQVEKAKPAVAYWCNYWIVNQVLAKGLHNADDESTTYTMGLMDKLEQTKREHAQDDAVIDDVAGQAYVEQFGLETFNRADNAIRANKATRQTADTFQAAATFLELDHIWGPVDPEVASKIKYAKFHALRIAKALKAGEDPNLSNPAPDPPAQEETPLDPNDPEAQALNGHGSPAEDSHRFQPSVEEIPDEHDRLEPRLARTSSLDQSLHPSRAPSVPRSMDQHYSDLPAGVSLLGSDVENFYNNTAKEEVSPLAPSTIEGGNSEGGGYFPAVPDEHADELRTTLPGHPLTDQTNHSTAPADSQPNIPTSCNEYVNSPPPDYPQYPSAHHDPSVHQDPSTYVRTSPLSSQRQSFHQQPYSRDPTTSPEFVPHAAPPPLRSVPPVSSMSQRGIAQPSSSQRMTSQVSHLTDEEKIMKAQKHARWAISALNFEDVATAVKELKGALQTLGAV